MRWVTGRGVRVGAHFVSSMPEDGQAVVEAKAGRLTPARALKSGAQRLGRRLGCSGRGG
jgi:hypothetical protein